MTTATSLDALKHENTLLKGFFEQIEKNLGESVEERYAYGNVAKQILRHVSIRQSALFDVATSISQIPTLCELSGRMLEQATRRRVILDDLVNMSRSVQGLYLNVGQNFDQSLSKLIRALDTEIDWELSYAIPEIRQLVDTSPGLVVFKSARYVTRHAPTTLNTSGQRWHERAPVVSRFVTLFDHIRDYPRAARNKRVS
jgi:hypothetical protein